VENGGEKNPEKNVKPGVIYRGRNQEGDMMELRREKFSREESRKWLARGRRDWKGDR